MTPEERKFETSAQSDYAKSMENRLGKLEEEHVDTRDRLARIEASMATRSDMDDLKGQIRHLELQMHQMESRMIRWLVGTIGAVCLAGITVMTFVLNNAVPKLAPVRAETSPIQIFMPGR